MAPQIERPLPPYLQILQSIRAQIDDGSLGVGEAVPSERQISADWSVSRATATKVLAALRSEGLVESIQGVGTVVRKQADAGHSARDRVASMRRTGRIYPPNERAKIVAAEVVDAPEEVAAALGLEVGASVIRRQRVTFRDDVPVSASTSWFAGELEQAAPKLLVAERLREGTPAYIEAQTGRKFANGRDQMAARKATAGDAELLGLEEGGPVLAGRNWIYDTEGDVVEYGQSIAVADRWSSYDYDIAG
ncbi:GntR family transcriptional regulator [Streptomyces sp. NPDC015032]|uniref:GntR family transcriptional regulator n=1 Tax=Streptomyces sp. NPDC015032 TaxID=3364937 RepID=UPI0036FE9930